MSLPSIQLDAFVAVSKTLSFSRAAKELYVTQSALSQRIKKLEDELGVTLLIRDPSGIRITEFGEKLLRYCQVKDRLEEELLSELTPGKSGELAGIIKIAAFSSVLRSVIIPAVAPLLRIHPKIKCDFLIRQMKNIPGLLQRAEVDFIVLDYSINKPNIEEHIIGYEDYVVIESLKFKCPEDIFLDNDADDKATENFFNHQDRNNFKYRSLYMGETYSILNGVMQGLGRAVMPRHLINKDLPIKIVKGFKPYKREVTLHYFKQPFYSKLHKETLKVIIESCPKIMKNRLG